jgi:hypothetical protein
MYFANTQENKSESMENDNDEHVPLGESQPWKLGNTKVYLEKNIPRFPIQPTEINRHTDGKSISNY